MKKLYEEASVQDIAAAIREKTGGAETYRIAQMGAAVRSIPDGDQIAHADIPDYVKDGVLALAQKVQAVKTASSIVFVTVADAHHATDESTGWKANIEAGNMDACRAIKALSHVTPLDFAAFLGDLTFGYKTTTTAQFEAQCREFHRWLEEGLRGIPQLWTPGNHDTGEYFAAETGSLTNLYGAALIRKYFSDYNTGAVYGSAEAGYCYRDLPGKKLRIINLNTVEGEITGGETAADALSEAQLLWFAQTLADLGSKADSAAWGFVILGHYPLDWGSARAGGKVLKAYLDGGSVTIGSETVSFAGKNGAVCYGNFHGHLHNFKTSRIYVVPDNVSQYNPPTQQMAALRICCPSANYYRTNEVGENDLPDSNRIEFGEETTYSKAPGVTDTAFTVNVIDPAEKKIYSFCYGAGYDRTLSFDFAVIMHAVRTTLTGCCGSNAATAVEDGAAYTTTLTPKNGYSFDTVRVSMGGTDITATAYNAETGVVSVARVTGDITITATASKPVTYTNVVPTAVDSSGASLPYQEGYNLSSSGDVQEENGFVTTGFIPLSGNVTKHIYRIGGDGIIFSKAEEHSRVGWYDSTFQLLGNGEQRARLRGVFPHERKGQGREPDHHDRRTDRIRRRWNADHSGVCDAEPTVSAVYKNPGAQAGAAQRGLPAAERCRVCAAVADGAVFCARRAASGRHGVSGCAVGLPTDARRRCERIQHRRGNDRAGLHPVYQWRDICMLRPGACARAGDRHV